MNTAKPAIYVLIAWIVTFFFTCAVQGAMSGTFSGSMGITGEWWVDGTTLHAEGEFTSDFNGDQIDFDLGSGGGAGGPQATGPGQVKTFHLTRSIGSATEGTGRLRIFSTSGGTVTTYVRATVTWEWTAGPDTDCKASVNITNPYGVPTWFRVQHSIDGELGRALLQPGQSWVQEWEVTCGGTFVLSYQPTGELELDGVWLYPDEEEPTPDEEAWEDGEPVNVGPPEEPAPQTPPPPTPEEANLPVKGKSPAEAWQPKPDPVDDTDLLDRPTYREGVDKVVKAVRDNTTAVTRKIDDLKDALTDDLGEIDEGAPEIPDVSLVMPTNNEAHLFPTAPPDFFEGTLGKQKSFGHTSSAITVNGFTFPGTTFTVNLEDYDTPIQWFRALCSVALWILFWFALTKITINMSK